jgi:hypothetical protein
MTCAKYCAAAGISTSMQRTLLKRARMNGGVAQRLKADEQTLLNESNVVTIAFVRRRMLCLRLKKPAVANACHQMQQHLCSKLRTARYHVTAGLALHRCLRHCRPDGKWNDGALM